MILRQTRRLGKRGHPATYTQRETVVLHHLLFPGVDGYKIDHIKETSWTTAA